jgi:hypothetical protein
MGNKQHYLATLTLAGLALFGVPAMADPITSINVSNVQADWSQGEGTTTNLLGGIYYAGPIIFTIGGTQTIVWCDDLYNDVYIGSSDQYYELDAKDANAYLSNSSLTPSQQSTVDQEIAGLAYEGTILAEADKLTPASGAETQLAIWEIEYPGLADTDPTFQSGVEDLIGQAPADYDAMLKAGYTYGELESPGCGQPPGTITYTNGCQIQGQIFVRDPVPEPSSLPMLLAGLAAIAGAFYLARRKATA